VWIIQVDSTLTIADNTNMVLSGGALSRNIFWAVSAAVTIGNKAHFEGIINTATAVSINNGASVNGRLLAGTAVTLNQNTITPPAYM
jgi:hypothetical protein